MVVAVVVAGARGGGGRAREFGLRGPGSTAVMGRAKERNHPGDRRTDLAGQGPSGKGWKRGPAAPQERSSRRRTESNQLQNAIFSNA